MIHVQRYKYNLKISVNLIISQSLVIILSVFFITESGQFVAGINAGVGIFLLVSVAVSAGVIYCRRNKTTQPGQNASITLIQLIYIEKGGCKSVYMNKNCTNNMSQIY